MKLFKRRYRTKNQKIALAGFSLFLIVVGLTAMIIVSAQTPQDYQNQARGEKSAVVAEYIHRVDGRGHF